MLPRPNHPSRIISAVPPLQHLFARALSTSIPAQAGGQRPPKAPQGPDRFLRRDESRGSFGHSPSSRDGRDEGRGSYGQRSWGGRSVREADTGAGPKLRYTEARRVLSERKSRQKGYSSSDFRTREEGARGSMGFGERTSRRLTDLGARSAGSGQQVSTRTPAGLTFGRPDWAASSTDAAPRLLSDMGLPENLLNGLIDVLGPKAAAEGKTSAIQSLAYKAMIGSNTSSVPAPASSAAEDGGLVDGETTENGHQSAVKEQGQGWVLGAETGSGKTLAYLLPVMHHLKRTESPSPSPSPSQTTMTSSTAIQPRAIVLSPTHELTRQSTHVAKTLSHSLKLRIKGLSSTRWGSVDGASGVDVLLGTTGSVRKMLGVGRDGERWGGEDREVKSSKGRREVEEADGREAEVEEAEDDAHEQETGMRGDKGAGKLDVGNVEWVVIDEADVLLGPDFAPETRAILSSLPFSTSIILCTATLPPSLLQSISGPPLSSRTFTHLISPDMHRLPRGLQTKFISDTGGNLAASVVAEVKTAFEEDNLRAMGTEQGSSRAVVFCNTDGRVRQIARKFAEKDIQTLCWTSKGVEETRSPTATPTEHYTPKMPGEGKRLRGKQGELASFLSTHTNKPALPALTSGNKASPEKAKARVLITTSLLSRGLDFSGDISTVVLVDPPRDALDFVHRAGRTARAGRKGRVIVFGMGARGDVKGFHKGRGLKGRIGEEVSRVMRRGK